MKSAITVAIGVFQAFVGFQIMGLVVKNDVTLVELGDIAQPRLWLTATATILVAALIIRRTKGALLIGVCFTAMAWNLLGLPNSLAGDVRAASPAVAAAASGALPSPESSLLGLDFGAALREPQAFWSAVVCMLFVVLFDTAGVQYGIGQQAGLLDQSGALPGAKLAYVGSAMATTVGAFMGTSPVIIHNESAAGVQEGGRTGLCAVVTGLLFLASPLLVPIIELIPPEASAPCLIIVGAMMMGPVKDIDFSDLKLALPAFLTICVTPMAYSISAGIFAGIACYFVLLAVLRLAEAGGSAGRALGARRRPETDRYADIPEAW
jgi:AGZA family xanthine/uracil permease-like MFS transporter